MSQITSGRLTASHINARLLGVCDHPVALRTVEVDLRARVGVGGGDAAAVRVTSFALAVDVRVVRLVGDALGDSVGAGGSGKSLGWFLVATMIEIVAKLRLRKGCLGYACARSRSAWAHREFIRYLYRARMGEGASASRLRIIPASSKGYCGLTLGTSLIIEVTSLLVPHYYWTWITMKMVAEDCRRAVMKW
jgi:hypothetical protein